RPQPPDCGGQRRRPAAAGEEILVEDEEGVHGEHVAARVPDDEVAIVEPLLDRSFDQLVIAMMLAHAGEGAAPPRAMREFGPRHDLDDKGMRAEQSVIAVANAHCSKRCRTERHGMYPRKLR